MRKAIYPGTFDPMTNGHLDLVERAGQLFDEVVIGVSESPKKNTLFSLDERIEIAREITSNISNVTVAGFSGLLVDFLDVQDCLVVLRGLRALTDFEFEFHLASANKRLRPNIETIFMTPDESNHFISSTIVKEIAKYGGDVSSFVDPHVEMQLKLKYQL